MGHQVDQRSVSAAAGDGPTKGQRTKDINSGLGITVFCPVQ